MFLINSECHIYVHIIYIRNLWEIFVLRISHMQSFQGVSISLTAPFLSVNKTSVVHSQEYILELNGDSNIYKIYNLMFMLENMNGFSTRLMASCINHTDIINFSPYWKKLILFAESLKEDNFSIELPLSRNEKFILFLKGFFKNYLGWGIPLAPSNFALNNFSLSKEVSK